MNEYGVSSFFSKKVPGGLLEGDAAVARYGGTLSGLKF
jgi:hypothetical protein